MSAADYASSALFTTYAREVGIPMSTNNRIFVNSAQQDRPFDGWTEVQGGGTTNAAPAAAAFGERLYVFAKGIN